MSGSLESITIRTEAVGSNWWFYITDNESSDISIKVGKESTMRGVSPSNRDGYRRTHREETQRGGGTA